MINESEYHKIGEELAATDQVECSQLFGKPCLKTNNKAFAAFYQDQMVFKLGQQEAELLRGHYPGSVNWDPSGKEHPMKDWLQVPTEFAADWRKLAKQAMTFVQSIKK